ncbi:MAG: HEAT repeat domain-containing protein, partial [Planctomycetota bacterium]
VAPLSRDPVWVVRAAVAAAVGIATGTPPQFALPRPPWMAPPPEPWPGGREAGVAILLPLLGDEEAIVRAEAARRLCALGERGILQRFVEALASPDEAQWREALEILIDPSIQGVEALPAILARLARTEGADRRPFLQALGHLRDPRGAEVLAKDMREAGAVRLEEGTLAEYAALMLSNLREAAIPPLRAALAPSEDRELRRRAARAATFMPLPAAGDLLLELATRIGEDPTLREIAIRAAPRVAGPRAAGPLKRALYAEPDPGIRDHLNCALHDFF